MLNYNAFIKEIYHFFVKNTSFLMSVGWVPSSVTYVVPIELKEVIGLGVQLQLLVMT